jgi:flagellar biosynthesis protein FliR
MNVFFVIAIIILTVSNVLLWIISKGLQIMFKNLANKVVELGEAILDELGERKEQE